MAKGQTYDEDFKKTIAPLYLSKKPVFQITRLYGISNLALYKWVKLYSPIKSEDKTVTTNKEFQKLKKELSKIREENKILKKEKVTVNNYEIFNQAKMAIFEFIESWYNIHRIHSKLNYRTPNQKYNNYILNMGLA